MCTIKDINDYKIANKPVVCYKALGMSNGKFYTLWQNKEIPEKYLNRELCHAISIDDIHSFYVLKADGEETFNAYSFDKDNNPDKWDTATGFFDSYMTYKQALWAPSVNYSQNQIKVFKCVIPEGTKYYEDEFGHYSSAQLQILSEVTNIGYNPGSFYGYEKLSAHISNDDIECYRIFLKSKDGLHLPILNTKINDKYVSSDKVLDNNLVDELLWYDFKGIIDNDKICIGSDNLLFCYKYFLDAKNVCDIFFNSEDYVIYKCIIPIGTKYFEKDNTYNSWKLNVDSKKFEMIHAYI